MRVCKDVFIHYTSEVDYSFAPIGCEKSPDLCATATLLVTDWHTCTVYQHSHMLCCMQVSEHKIR
jgi:hypothetical protein